MDGLIREMERNSVEGYVTPLRVKRRLVGYGWRRSQWQEKWEDRRETPARKYEKRQRGLKCALSLWGIRKSNNPRIPDGYQVTHIPSGLRLTGYYRPLTEEQCISIAEQMDALPFDWLSLTGPCVPGEIENSCKTIISRIRG